MIQNRLFALWFCLLLVFSKSLFAQDYNPLPQNLTQLYRIENSGNSFEWYFAARVDSAKMEANDSGYYLHRIIRNPLPTDTQIMCDGQPVSNYAGNYFTYLIDQDHYFGQKMLRSSSGMCRFVSSAADTFVLESRASLGNSWVFHGNVTAHIDSILYRPILGQMDSIKYINLSDGKQIQLSQHYGMIRCFPFLLSLQTVNIDSTVYESWGIPELGIGNHFPSIAEIYDFDSADKIQMTTNRFPISMTWYINIFEQTVYDQAIPGPSIQYNVTRESARIVAYPNPVPSYFPPTSSIWNLDTTYMESLHRLPFENPASIAEVYDFGLQQGIHTSNYNSRITLDFSKPDTYDSCANVYRSVVNRSTIQYTQGLGLTTLTFSDDATSENRYLTCYQKGAETYGTCQDLGFLYSAADPLEGQMKLFPNPANQRLSISLADDLYFGNSQISISSLEGKVIYSQKLNLGSNHIEIETETFKSGMYLLTIEKFGFGKTSQRFVVQH